MSDVEYEAKATIMASVLGAMLMKMDSPPTSEAQIAGLVRSAKAIVDAAISELS